ncbi:succinylglutamate desuccinylase/aspartoacylase family protein [Luteimonas vadosa]|uniref:Succinylglutamate desuccinylase/aspartoacylase family protein n=1 Tax=Luteimonas vadosa TaxID=1165507 RepID=A0ABP9DY66_9GAMM
MNASRSSRAPFSIGGISVEAGKRASVHLPLSVLSNSTPVGVPVHVVHGRQDGPTMFVSAAIHGDEVVGVEIVRRLLTSKVLNGIAGTALMVPIVNAFGFISHSRYLPDRRDLNRSFPGSANGSLAAQLAHMFMTEIVARSDYGIDLHTAAINRSNLPQIRVDTEDEPARALAEAFGSPIILHSPLRPGSLRESASNVGVPVVVYECGEALRFDELSIRIGIKGVLRAMASLDMLPRRKRSPQAAAPVFSHGSRWLRAPEGGIFRARRTLGHRVQEDELLGIISDPFGQTQSEVRAMMSGLIIGRTNVPAVNQGDALFHIASLDNASAVQREYGRLERQMDEERLLDEDEIL